MDIDVLLYWAPIRRDRRNFAPSRPDLANEWPKLGRVWLCEERSPAAHIVVAQLLNEKGSAWGERVLFLKADLSDASCSIPYPVWRASRRKTGSAAALDLYQGPHRVLHGSTLDGYLGRRGAGLQRGASKDRPRGLCCGFSSSMRR